jgi:hypothetical protein
MINTGVFTQSLAAADPAWARFSVDNPFAGPLSYRPLCSLILEVIPFPHQLLYSSVRVFLLVCPADREAPWMKS